MFSIRIAAEKDCSTIGQLIRGLADYERMTEDVIWNEEMLHHELFIEKNAEVILGELDGKPIGFALYFFNFSTFVGRKGLYLEDLFILEEHRKNGYGKEFFKALAQIAKERNCGRMEWVCLDWNQPSIDFYTKRLAASSLDQWTIYRLTADQFDTIIGLD